MWKRGRAHPRVFSPRLCALHFFLSPALSIQNTFLWFPSLMWLALLLWITGHPLKCIRECFECTLQSAIFPKDLHQLIIATKTIPIDYVLTLTSFDVSICQRMPAKALKLPISLLSSIRADDCFSIKSSIGISSYFFHLEKQTDFKFPSAY